VQRSENIVCCPCYHIYKNTLQTSPVFVLLKHGRLCLNILKEWFMVGNMNCGIEEVFTPSENSVSFEQGHCLKIRTDCI
jgi:hypothetical protein